MLMYIFKNNKEFYNNYFKIYDIKKHKLIIMHLILFIILINSLITHVPSSYLQDISHGISLTSFDNLYDYFIPLIASLFVIYVFYNDYTAKIYELLTFYNRNTINYIILFRWLICTLPFILGSFISGLIYYRTVSFLDITNILLSVRFIPNILFLCSLVLLVITVFKNIYASILSLISYYCVDILSGGSLFKIFSLGAHSNNFYYTISPTYYIINRLTLVVLSCLFVFISCKISSRL